MVSENDLAEFGDLWSLVYIIFAKEMVDSFGEEGKKSLARAVLAYGKARGERLRKRHEEQGLPIKMRSLFEYNDLPGTPGTRKERKVFDDDWLVSYTFECPYEKIWRANNGNDLGLIYCQNFHHAFWQTYRPDIDVQIPEILTKDDPSYLFVVTHQRSRLIETNPCMGLGW
jgi:hypothetical protein